VVRVVYGPHADEGAAYLVRLDREGQVAQMVFYSGELEPAP
jgi:hypothetical protein